MDYADDIAFLANTPTQAETLLHSLERAAAGIGLYVNANKTECMSFNQRGNISMLNGSSLKLVDKCTYLESSVSSTKTDINMRLAKVWKTIDRLSVIWKSDLTDKIKWQVNFSRWDPVSKIHVHWFQRTIILSGNVSFLIKTYVLHFVCIHIEVNATCCLFQTMQQGFSLGGCNCKKCNFICIVSIHNSFCGVSSVSCCFFFFFFCCC